MGTLAREYLKKMHNFDVNAEIEPIVQDAVDHTNQTGKPAVKETPKAGNVTESSITVDMMNGIKKQIDAANKERAKHGDDELTTIIWSKRNNVASVSPDFGSTEFDLDIEDKRTAEKIAASLRMNFEIKE
jgi:hypothetical protein